ncbi:hypothetical protein A2961_04155 [Candidatus Woesebacteria bacterium RIFCSPLOWO2_01_FULL_39_21]|uniref:Uncharacterized protein n=1 Tax=Candidatus Woesebacteria bacterium RIFCSPLOWO2_01_FULL_39_21 TaxID=1802519 RepID=A0A1F8BBU4_9BACT|nr:MAG: hypothetical protein A2961_04155 [Candidatus Woesebacteria bacterium RIFCSPLOWO2_01_FULL_39_21]
MFRLSYGKRPIVEESQITSAGICVRNFLADIKQDNLDLNKEDDIKELISRVEMGTTFNLKQEKWGEVEYSEPNSVKMTYTRSNLGRGFIFWFICNLCGRRVRYLYFPPNSQILACRRCHKLAYEKQNDSKSIRHLNRLFR